ncbi:MAG: PH domain-containing protein [Candidatus Latescibacteria bacterium]|nr:PH domain-containing protein [Candidatus Latescibacterota bacterium]NIM21444.1 PH domain-containing protein [Candidatus Latescibacterota bacterium]NIM65625.1 PH domain-containing protein [Candidatus Latescibacterota bacterium]NIO02006.1 PH domain-containing protein [Candidatus Latescibacterota bacterium]NIO28818.1 PH domain-containing protein [Candidatus Latescibacterota bacterium]
MQIQTVKPDPRYLGKMRLIMFIIAVLAMGIGILIGSLVSLDEGPRAGKIVVLVFLLVDVAWWLPANILAGFYYRSLKYEIQDDEVIVHVGIWTKSVKHVPYRTVTNLKVKRDIFDRWIFGIGTLNIQTAGMSGTTGAEESLVGMVGVQDVYDLVVKKLRRFRGSMAPTAAEEERAPETGSSDTLLAILDELRAIRKTMEK